MGPQEADRYSKEHDPTLDWVELHESGELEKYLKRDSDKNTANSDLLGMMQKMVDGKKGKSASRGGRTITKSWSPDKKAH